MCWIDPTDAANYAMEIAMAGEGLPEDVRIYGLPDLRMGIDYDINAAGWASAKSKASSVDTHATSPLSSKSDHASVAPL